MQPWPVIRYSQRVFPAIGAFLFCMSTTATLPAQPAASDLIEPIQAQWAELNAAIDKLKAAESDSRQLADIQVYTKAVKWAIQYDEFYPSKSKGPSPYFDFARTALQTARHRADELADGKATWLKKAGTTIRGYRSRIDESIQPYALTLPEGLEDDPTKRYPLYVKLHGRSATLNELRFIHDHDNQPTPAGQTWVQIDVYGRGNNAYRWAGETDVFEAIEDTKHRVRIDDRRITLWGFSMGGAGAWHLGLHYPSKWASVGAGAGFVDFYDYQHQTTKLPDYQDATLRIYDAIDYVLNAADVPFCAYGGELDKQLAAAKRMAEKATELKVPLKVLVGPQTAHKFHPDSFAEFMAFHREHSEKGRKKYPGPSEIHFVTNTLKYNTCEWLTIEEMETMYQPAIVESYIDMFTGRLTLKTQNVRALRIARDIAPQVVIDGTRLPLLEAADGLLQDVYYRIADDDWWEDLSHAQARIFEGNPDFHKRHNLQGPIDDAFMEPFVCVRGTGHPWSATQDAWARWTLNRFQAEFDRWFRGRVPCVDDTKLTEEMIATKNIILFGDPGSNAVLAKIVKDLPVQWTKDAIQINDQTYDPASYGLSFIYPNPLNEEKYVVVNSGHTFHEKDFKASNAWLFPRLGDIAIQKIEQNADDTFSESIVHAAMFDTEWLLHWTPK